MYCSQRRTNSEREINAVIDNILRKDRSGQRDTRNPQRDKKDVRQSGYEKCQAAGHEEGNNGIESSARFSLRVMEAMRSLQRNNQNQSLTSSNMEEIVNFIEANYHFDGDLDAQVRTVLSRISRQGFIISLGEEDYHLVGPFASYINKKESDPTSDHSRPCKRKKTSRSCGSPHDERETRHRKSAGRRPKERKKCGRTSQEVIKDPGSKNKVGFPIKSQDVTFPCNENKSRAKNKSRGPSRKSKSVTKKKCCLLDQEYERGCPEQNIKFNEDCQSGSSSTSYVTCFEDFNPEIGTNEKLYKNVSFVGGCGRSGTRNENNASSSEDESSQDSIYQELKTKNVKAVGSNSKDLKKWIKSCRRGCKG